MDPAIFRVLDRKRHGQSLGADEIGALVRGAADGSWPDAELGAFLMAAAIQGLDVEETRALTLEMRDSGEVWELGKHRPGVVDKHSTGGVGDKVSLVMSPLAAACDLPIAMLTGRGLGHTGGTADKLEAIPGCDLALDRDRCLQALDEIGCAIGMATGEIAPADKRLYALRDRTGTVASIELITASILSKKLATGASAIVFDVKTGDGAFLPEIERGRALAKNLVEISESVGMRARTVITDMSQPLGRWVGHAAEVRETLECLRGDGPADLMEVTYVLTEEVSELRGDRLGRDRLEAAIASGAAYEKFLAWAAFQGAEPSWVADPVCELAPEEVVLTAPRAGVVAQVANRRLGELLTSAGGGRLEPGGPIDFGVSLRVEARLGDRIEAGDELARLYLRRRDEGLEQRFVECFEIAESGAAPELVREVISAS